MPMELLFENTTVMDDDLINHLLAGNFKKDAKSKRYHYTMLGISIVCACASVYFGLSGIKLHNAPTFFSAVAMMFVAACAFIFFLSNTSQKQLNAYKKEHLEELTKPRHLKVYKNILYQSAGKKSAEYRLYQFSSLSEYSHYFLLQYGNGYIAMDKNGFTLGTAEDFKEFFPTRIKKNC